jgi:hypothetical protein
MLMAMFIFSIKATKRLLEIIFIQEKMSFLSILCIESEIVNDIKWEEHVHKFVTIKSRMKHIYLT